MKKYVLLLFVSLLADVVSAQQANEYLQARARQIIEDFQMYLSTIASKTGVSETNKDIATTSALDLFIGEGKSYEYVDNDGNKRTHEPVKMQILGKNRKYVPVAQYLETIRNLAYTKVVIDTADIVEIDTIMQAENGSYEAIAHYRQRFLGYRDGRVVYQDVTDQKIKLYCKENASPMCYVFPTPFGTNEVHWRVLLGDIYVVNGH